MYNFNVWINIKYILLECKNNIKQLMMYYREYLPQC